jgi:hypothetical protein
LSMGIYCQALNGNQLVQLRGCLQSFIRINVQADLEHVYLSVLEFFVCVKFWGCVFTGMGPIYRDSMIFSEKKVHTFSSSIDHFAVFFS